MRTLYSFCDSPFGIPFYVYPLQYTRAFSSNFRQNTKNGERNTIVYDRNVLYSVLWDR